MTKQELNRDINRLWKKFKNAKGQEAEKYYEFVNGEGKKEFKRLYLADKNFEYCNKKSILQLMAINSLHRFEPQHMFGIYADENPLLS